MRPVKGRGERWNQKQAGARLWVVLWEVIWACWYNFPKSRNVASWSLFYSRYLSSSSLSLCIISASLFKNPEDAGDMALRILENTRGTRGSANLAAHRRGCRGQLEHLRGGCQGLREGYTHGHWSISKDSRGTRWARIWGYKGCVLLTNTVHWKIICR